jgi:hypothetical protein
MLVINAGGLYVGGVLVDGPNLHCTFPKGLYGEFYSLNPSDLPPAGATFHTQTYVNALKKISKGPTSNTSVVASLVALRKFFIIVFGALLMIAKLVDQKPKPGFTAEKLVRTYLQDSYKALFLKWDATWGDP